VSVIGTLHLVSGDLTCFKNPYEHRIVLVTQRFLFVKFINFLISMLYLASRSVKVDDKA